MTAEENSSMVLRRDEKFDRPERRKRGRFSFFFGKGPPVRPGRSGTPIQARSLLQIFLIP